jgi:hypothetical protein
MGSSAAKVANLEYKKPSVAKLRRKAFCLIRNDWGSEQIALGFNPVANSLIFSGFFQRTAAKNKEKEQETC